MPRLTPFAPFDPVWHHLAPSGPVWPHLAVLGHSSIFISRYFELRIRHIDILQESVTWIIPNKPIYVQAEHMMLLSNLMQGTADDPRAPLAGNLRPIQQTYGRVVRTNIHFDNNQVIKRMPKKKATFVCFLSPLINKPSKGYFWETNFLAPIFLAQILQELIVFAPKSFWTHNCLHLNLCTRIFFAQNFADPKCFPHNIFWMQNLFLIKKFLYQ